MIYLCVAVGGVISFGAIPLSSRTDVSGSTYYPNNAHPINRSTGHTCFGGIGVRSWYAPLKSKLSIGLQPYVRITGIPNNGTIIGANQQMDTLYRQNVSSDIGPYFGTQTDVNYKLASSERGYFTIGLFVDHVFNPGSVSFDIAPNTAEASE